MQLSSELNPQQRIALGVLIVIGLATLVFALFNIRRMVAAPFERDPALAGSLKTSDQLEAERISLLKSSDTDNDGLSDYDEQYIFLTSPYLEDYDGDGISDGAEVAANTDPKCPQGKTCVVIAKDVADNGSQSGTGSTNGATGGEAPLPDSLQAMHDMFGADMSALTIEKAEAQLKQLTSAELRRFMSRLGLPDEVLAKADDATLILLFVDTLRETGAPSESGAAPAPSGE